MADANTPDTPAAEVTLTRYRYTYPGRFDDDPNGEYCDASAAQAALSSQAATIQAHQQADADRRRLVRELDVIINGEEGAAPQASLCDIVSQMKGLQRTWSAPLVLQLESLAQLQRDLDVARGALLEISQRSCGCEPDTTWVCDACIARAALAGAKGEANAD